MRTRRPRCPLPEPLTADPLDHRVYADALLDCGRERESLRARRTALALGRRVRAVLWGQQHSATFRGRLFTSWPVRTEDDWRDFYGFAWRAPTDASSRRYLLSTPWDFPGLPTTRPDLVRDFLRHLARRVRLPNP